MGHRLQAAALPMCWGRHHPLTGWCQGCLLRGGLGAASRAACWGLATWGRKLLHVCVLNPN